MLDEKGQVVSVSHTGADAGYRAYFIVRPVPSGDERAKIAVSMANTGNCAAHNLAIVYSLVER